jgi:hypothetical protein
MSWYHGMFGVWKKDRCNVGRIISSTGIDQLQLTSTARERECQSLAEGSPKGETWTTASGVRGPRILGYTRTIP